MKLMADVIDLAINKYLWDGKSDNVSRLTQIFSCAAIVEAHKCNEFFAKETMRFLQSIGLDTTSRQEFRIFDFGPQQQYARALWLTWAAMIAREEGKTLTDVSTQFPAQSRSNLTAQEPPRSPALHE